MRDIQQELYNRVIQQEATAVNNRIRELVLNYRAKNKGYL